MKTPNSRLVPAESTMAILGTTPHLPAGYIVLVEPVHVSLPPGIVVSYTLCSVHHGKVLFEISNFSSEDIVIPRPSHIAKIYTCDLLPTPLNLKIKRILDDWLKTGIIKESESSYASQIVPVFKKSGEIRICIYFRHLNNKP